MQRIAARLVAWRTPLFIGFLLCTFALWPLSQSIRSDQSLENLFSPDDPRLLDFVKANKIFGSDSVILAAYYDPDLLTPKGLARLEGLTRQLAAQPFVTSAVGLSQLPHPRDPTLWRHAFDAMGEGAEAALREGLQGLQASLSTWRPRSLLEWANETPASDWPAVAEAILETELYRDVFVSQAGDAAAVLLTVDQSALNDGRAEPTIQQLREILRTVPPEEGRLVGSAIMIGDVHRYLSRDAARLQWSATAAMLVVIWLLFGGVRWILLPLLVVWTTGVATRAVAAVFDIRQSLVAAMTESLIAVIGVAATVHIAVFFAEETKREPDEVKALEKTLGAAGGSFLWTAVITAVGFLALLISSVRPVREYAVVMATASLLVGIASFALIPAGALMFRRLTSAAPKRGWIDGPATAMLEYIARAVGRQGTLFSIVLIVVMLLASGGFRKLQLETEFTRYFRADAPILASYNFVETHFGGAGLMDVVIPTESATPETIEKLRRVAGELKQLKLVAKVTGLHDVLDFVQRLVGSQRLSVRAGTPGVAAADLKTEPVPPRTWVQRLGQKVVDHALLAGLRLLPEGEARRLMRNFWRPEAGVVRLMLRVRERQALEGKAELIRDVERIVQAEFGPRVYATGPFVMLVFLVGQLVKDQWWAVAASGIGVVATASLAFGAVRYGLAAFAPKMVLVTAVVGAMGWLGMKVNVATAMIGSVSMGLVVAFSVPYINRYLQERRRGASIEDALTRTHGSAGKAMIYANLALMLGFLVLGASEFIPTVHFGLLVSVAVFGGAVGNLVLLPVVLRIVDRDWFSEPRSKPEQ